MISHNSQHRMPHKIYCGNSASYHHILCDSTRSPSQANQLNLADWVSILVGGPLAAASVYALIWSGWIISLASGVGG
ncbi:MAG: hypothetical protein RJA36_3741 [Pseudomonadota bacterium]|jgi:hypothetical protein